ncbi:MAG: 2-hydroxyacid dehydrogenase [Myxococcota bacterium]
MIRLSRWGKASYESPESVTSQKRALSEVVDVVLDDSDAEIVIVHSKMRIGPSEIDRMPSAQLIVTTTSGYEHMDIEALHAKGIRTLRMPLLRRDAVVDTALGLILSGMRRLHLFKSAASQNDWVRASLPNIQPLSFRGLTVGIVGCGVIGQHMITVLSQLGAQIVAYDPKGVPEGVFTATSIMDLATRVQVLSLHCDLNPTSANIVSKEVIFALPKGALLVNTARGGLVDEQAALEALSMGHLSYLGLDVFASEPYLDLDVVNRIPNLDLLPHAAGFHQNLLVDMQVQLVAICTAFVQCRALPYEVFRNS